jgi:hypothetical protein
VFCLVIGLDEPPKESLSRSWTYPMFLARRHPPLNMGVDNRAAEGGKLLNVWMTSLPGVVTRQHAYDPLIAASQPACLPGCPLSIPRTYRILPFCICIVRAT